jgi:hypothetical protein
MYGPPFRPVFYVIRYIYVQFSQDVSFVKIIVGVCGGVGRPRPTQACGTPLLCHTGEGQYPVFEYRTGYRIKSGMTDG